MFRNINNKTLLILFAALAVIAITVYFIDRKKGERSFKSELFKVDSALVTSITIYPKGKINEFLKLNKTGNNWEIESKGKKHPADTSMIQNILRELSRIIPERVAGTDRKSWKEYEMTDSLSTRVIVEQGKDVVADFRTGKMSFSQNRSRQSYGGYGMEVKSHIRVDGDEKIYVVDGYLSMMFNDNPSYYRNRIVARIDKNNITKLSFVYPGDSSFMLLREGSKWFVNDLPADSAAAEQWLNSLSYLSNGEFADEEAQPFNYPYYLKIEGSNMNVIELKGAKDTAVNKYFVKSSFNPSAVFGGSSANLFNQLFPARNKFLNSGNPDPKKSGK